MLLKLAFCVLSLSISALQQIFFSTCFLFFSFLFGCFGRGSCQGEDVILYQKQFYMCIFFNLYSFSCSAVIGAIFVNLLENFLSCVHFNFIFCYEILIIMEVLFTDNQSKCKGLGPLGQLNGWSTLFLLLFLIYKYIWIFPTKITLYNNLLHNTFSKAGAYKFFFTITYY